MKTNNFDKLFNTIMEEAKPSKKKKVIMESEGYDSADELEPFESDYVPTDELIRKEAMAQLRYKDIPYSEAKMLANDIVAMLTGQSFSSKSEFELYVSFEIKENLRAFYESKKVNKSKKVIKEDNNWQRNLMGKKHYYSLDDLDELDYEDIDIDECFNAVQMTILENKGLKDKLRGALNKFFESPDEYIWENIFEGDGFNWLGLKDPRTFDQLGFKVGKENFDILTKWTEAVDSGAFGDWDEYCDENAKTVFKNVGWGDLVTLAEKGWDYLELD